MSSSGPAVSAHGMSWVVDHTCQNDLSYLHDPFTFLRSALSPVVELQRNTLFRYPHGKVALLGYKGRLSRIYIFVAILVAFLCSIELLSSRPGQRILTFLFLGCHRAVVLSIDQIIKKTSIIHSVKNITSENSTVQNTNCSW